MSLEREPSGEYRQELMLVGQIDPDKAGAIGLNTPRDKVDSLPLDEALGVKKYIAASLKEELEPIWALGIESVVIEGSNILTPLAGKDDFSFREYAEQSPNLTVSVHRPLTVDLISLG